MGGETFWNMENEMMGEKKNESVIQRRIGG